MANINRPWMRWDGSSKKYTLDCDGCDFYRRIDSTEYCGVGEAFKVLERTDRVRRCFVKDHPSDNPSVKHLDEVIANS